jgi:peptidoglycan/LPS O-acetylase OafA/YrhL
LTNPGPVSTTIIRIVTPQTGPNRSFAVDSTVKCRAGRGKSKVLRRLPCWPQVQNMPSSPTRVTSRHIPALDGVRGVAAATVFIYHYGGGARSSVFLVHVAGIAIHLGWAGVSLFFVLSGFLITGILLGSMNRPQWRKTFFIRRALRIFPLYYFALLALIVVALLLHVPWSKTLPIWRLFLYLQGFPHAAKLETLSPIFVVGHLWSLAVEEQFYLVWPIFLVFAARRNAVRRLCAGVFLGSLLFRLCVYVFHLNYEWALYSIGGRAGEMAVGGFLAASLRGSGREWEQILAAAKPLVLSSLAVVIAIIWWAYYTDETGPWMATLGIASFSLMFASVIALCLTPGWTERFFSLPMLRWLGKVSYGIYVYHLLLYPFFAWVTRQFISNVGGDKYLLVLALVAAVGTLTTAWISFTLLESRFLGLKASLGKPQPVAANDTVGVTP